MAASAIHLYEHSQNSAGTLGLISRKDFLLRFWSFKNEGLRQGMSCLTARQRTAARRGVIL